MPIQKLENPAPAFRAHHLVYQLEHSPLAQFFAVNFTTVYAVKRIDVKSAKIFEIGDDYPQDPAGTKYPNALFQKIATILAAEMLKHMSVINRVNGIIREWQRPKEISRDNVIK